MHSPQTPDHTTNAQPAAPHSLRTTLVVVLILFAHVVAFSVREPAPPAPEPVEVVSPPP